ncbi:hypothetical protein MHU86_22835 [Fragilaria crotonensis]|nr:hypothetical protein MHU86_22835 [Fragilaria crotonensis]
MKASYNAFLLKETETASTLCLLELVQPTMSAYSSTSFSHALTGSRNEDLDLSIGLLTISEDEPLRMSEYSLSSNSLNHTMSRSKSYKVDLSSLGGASDMQLSSNAHRSNCNDPASWGYFVDSVNPH